MATSSFGQAGEAPKLDFRLFCYSRAAYAEHLLRQLQARGNAVVPDEVVEDVKREIKRKGGACSVRDCELAMRRLTRMRNAARRRGDADVGPSLQHWYESSALVRSKISGVSPFRLTREMEEALLDRFRRASSAFDQMMRDDGVVSSRKNFVSYPYAFRRIIDHLRSQFPGIEQFTTQVLPAEGRDRKCVNQSIWGAICSKEGWEDNSGKLPPSK
jgi:hypothetical protein